MVFSVGEVQITHLIYSSAVKIRVNELGTECGGRMPGKQAAVGTLLLPPPWSR